MIPKYFACVFAAVALAGCLRAGNGLKRPIAWIAGRLGWSGPGPNGHRSGY
jgi:hypothetical protein